MHSMFGSGEEKPLGNASFPPKASEYTRSLVDKKKEGSVVSSPGQCGGGAAEVNVRCLLTLRITPSRFSTG